jgi:hypothetical protein
MVEPRRESDREALAWYYDERKRAIETLRLIEEGGWTFHAVCGNEPMREVTAERAERQREIIHRMNRFIAEFEGRNA